MAIQKINLGASPDGRGGDTYREAHTKINSNFTDLDTINSDLQGQINSVSGGHKAYITYAAMVADKVNITANSSIDITNDTDPSKNGAYVYNGTTFTKSAYDVKALTLAEINNRLPVTYSSNPVIDTSDNKYTKDNTLGAFINSSNRKVTGNSTGIFTSVPVKSGQRVLINNLIPDTAIVISYSKTKKPSIDTVLTKGLVESVNGIQVSIVPEGVTYLHINVKLDSISLDLVDTLVINLEDGKIDNYNGTALADETARNRLNNALYKSDLKLDTSPNLLNMFTPETILLGKYVKAASGLLLTNGTTASAEIKITAGKTYTIYADSFRDKFFVAGTSIKSGAEGATEVVIIPSNTPNGNTIQFTAPVGHNWLYINTFIQSGDFDITASLYVNEGTTSGSGTRHSISALAGYEFNDTRANARIDDLVVGINPSVLKDKSWVVIGDSITEKNFRANVNYHDYIKADVGGMNTYNHGRSGTGYFNRYDAATQAPQKTADYVTVLMGTNDWGNQTAANKKLLGDFLDTGTTTISGCINTMLTDTLTQFPKAKIGVITPLPRLSNWGVNGADNSYGYNLETLVDLIIKYCNHYSIPCLDLYHNSGLPVWIPSANTYYFTAPSQSSPDGLHPNDAGQRVMADKIKPFLESL